MDKEIIIDGIDVSGYYQYMPRHMEDYDIDTLNYCRYHFKPCKDVDVKYCYFKQLKQKEQALDEIEDIADNYNRVEKTSQYYRDGFDEIQDIINKVKEQKC